MANKIVTIDGLGEVVLQKRKGSRSIRLRISGGKVVVSQPTWLPYEAGLRFLMSKQAWAQEQLEKQQESTQAYHQGQQVGTNRLLVIEEGLRRTSRVTSDLVIITLIQGEDVSSNPAQSYIKKAVQRALRKDAEEFLPARLHTLADIYGFRFSSVSIKLLKRRWGSCTSKKDIALNLHLMELDQAHIDYVLLHELVHTEHMNHGAAFWDRMEQVYPNARKVAKTVRRLQP